MGFLNPAPEDDYRIQTMGLQNPTTELPGPSALEGIGEAAQKGIAGGLVKAGGLVNAIGTSIDSAADAYLPSWMASAVRYAPFNPNAVNNAVPEDIRKRNEAARDVVATWAETGQDPRTTGSLGRSLSNAAQGLTVGAIGNALGGPIGAAALSGTTFGHDSYVEGKKQGLDDTTALGAAILAGGFAAAGAFLPGKFGSSYTFNTVGGAATNVAFGMAQRGATSALLDANGYHDMAGQYRIMDHEGIVADAIFGSVFGGVAHFVDGRRATPDQVDVAAAMAMDEHYARSAPGVPTTPEVANLHGQAMREALDALAEGREPNTPADVATRVADGVVPDPQHDSSPAAHEAAAESLPGYRDAVRSVDPSPEPAATPETVAGSKEPSAFSQEFPLFDPFTSDRMENILKQMGDQTFEGPEGNGITYREAIAQMHNELAEVDTFAKAHEAAAACFLRTGAVA